MADICNEFVDNGRNCVRRDCCEVDHRDCGRFDLEYERRSTMQLCAFIESLKEIKYALRHTKIGEKEIYDGIREFEKGIHEVQEGLCEIEKAEKEICEALECIENGLGDLLRERF